ncbi:MAG: hypothetical protein IH993_05895, partial [Proteobacteria bacterium]|nr:hypothetical protein [Pseudomonadota bacterium]
ATPVEQVRQTMNEFPDVAIHEGWVPQVFSGLPETAWSFVHLDLDMYQPTLDGLRYFYPRLNKGGVIINDDYLAPLFPGAARAWDEFCEQLDLPFIILDHGQSIIIKSDERADPQTETHLEVSI